MTLFKGADVRLGVAAFCQLLLGQARLQPSSADALTDALSEGTVVGYVAPTIDNGHKWSVSP